MSLIELGAALRKAREEKGLSLRDVQAELRIRQRYLQALEEGRWEEIPAPAYARGFARSYGKFLGVDVEPYLRAPERTDERPAAAVSRPSPAPPPARPRPAARPASGAPRRRQDRRRQRLRRPLRLLWLALPIAVVALVVVLYALGAAPGHSHRPTVRTPRHPTTARLTGRPNGARRGGHAHAGASGYRVVASQGDRLTLAALPPVRIVVRFRGRCWLSAQVDGVPYPGLTYQSGEGLAYTVAHTASFDVGLPANAAIWVDGKRLATQGSAPLLLTVEAQGG